LDLETSLEGVLPLVEMEGVLPLKEDMQRMEHHHDGTYASSMTVVQATHRSLRRFFVMVRKASSTLVDSIADVSMKGIPNLFAYACNRIKDNRLWKH